MQEVYITRIAKYLPNKVVTNDTIEDFLGKINGENSKAKNIVLRSNKIEERYYALDLHGNATHTNEELAANSIRALIRTPKEYDEIELLTVGTSSPDQIMPSHAVMVHGKVPELGAIEVLTASGNCCSGVQGMKYAYLQIASGQIKKAISSSSERLSKVMRAEQFAPEVKRLNELKENSILQFEKDFLRWMLSDGAASMLLSCEKNTDDISLKIDWIEIKSYAHEVKSCMYMGSVKKENGDLISYKDFTPEEVKNQSILSIKQDIKLLDENILKYGAKMLKDTLTKKKIEADNFDYFLPHISSYYFYDKTYEVAKEYGVAVSKEKWFTNLKTIGNVGSASPLLILEELMNSGKLKKGEKLLMMVPESARFSYVYVALTVC